MPNQSSRFCDVCNHPDRAEIELAVLSISPSKPELTLEVIADAYDISVDKLRVHALMHTPLALDFSQESADVLVRNFQQKAGLTSPDGAASHLNTDGASAVPNIKSRDRIADRVNMREGDLLLAAANEYLTTMTILGRRIKHYAAARGPEEELALPNFCSKAVVDLYIGCGSEMRQAIKGLKELNDSLNGSHDSSMEGLKALAAALSGKQSSEASYLDDEDYEVAEDLEDD